MGNETKIVVWPSNHCFTIKFVNSFMSIVTRSLQSTEIICKKEIKKKSEDEIVLCERTVELNTVEYSRAKDMMISLYKH